MILVVGTVRVELTVSRLQTRYPSQAANPDMVGVGRLELPASCSQSTRASNCATPRKFRYDAVRFTHRPIGIVWFCATFVIAKEIILKNPAPTIVTGYLAYQ